MKILIQIVLLLLMTVVSYGDWKLAGNALTASDGQSGDYFGMSVDVGEEYAVIGAPSVSMGGAVYIFKKESTGHWIEYAVLDNPDMPDNLPNGAAASIGSFGRSVALTEKDGFFDVNPAMIVVGAPASYVYVDSTNVQTGAICTYVLTGASWEQQGTCILGHLGFADGSSSSFGTSVDIDSWVTWKSVFTGWVAESHAKIVAGNPGYDAKYQNIGAASFFDYNTSDSSWNLVSFTMGSGHADSAFGEHVAIYKDTVIVGETGYDIVDPNDDPDDGHVDMILNIGAVHYFSSDGVVLKTVYPPHEESIGNHHFGQSVAIFGDYSIVGEEHRTGAESGVSYSYPAVYILKNQVLHNVIEKDTTGFGYSVAIDDTHAAVGVLAGAANGMVFMYRKDANGNWDTYEPFYWLDHVKQSAFGFALALHEDELLVGAPFREEVKQFRYDPDKKMNPAILMYLLN